MLNTDTTIIVHPVYYRVIERQFQQLVLITEATHQEALLPLPISMA
ncbi:MAG: hypothetical protein H0X31_16335 [Nostocaceae cyanobacterium]|nr:hypothetical protein [Nostocaceae cyanobacterium]